MKIDNRMCLEFVSLPENIALSRVVVASFAAQLDFTLNDLEEIKVATSEAVSNAIIHGYLNKTDGLVRIRAVRRGGTLELAVEDDGVGIADIEQAMQPSYSTDPERMGLGFAFMKSFMDRVEVKSDFGKGTTVIMTKTVSAAAKAADRPS
jgi:stage II sporulation protein AB (anti-sigma F factor)